MTRLSLGVAIAAAAVSALVISSVAFSAVAVPSASMDDGDDSAPSKQMDFPPLVLGENPPKPDVAAAKPPTAASAPTNDSFAGATVLTTAGSSTLTGYWRGNLTEATIESHEPVLILTGRSFQVTHSVWLKWVAPASGFITVETEQMTTGPNDTTLGIFTGSTMSSATRRVISDDKDTAASLAGSQIIDFPVSKGTTYRFQVGGSSTVSPPNLVEFRLYSHLTAPSNDNRIAAADKSASTKWSSTTYSYGATVEPDWETVDNPTSVSYSRGTSQWYKWTPTSTAIVDLDTQGSAGDSYLAVFSQNTIFGFHQLAFNDDGGGGGSAKLDDLLFQANSTYYIQVGHLAYQDHAPITGQLRVHFAATTVGPSVSSVSPTSGTTAGGTKVTITGARLTGTAFVTLDGVELSNLTVLSSTKLTAILPAAVEPGTHYVMVSVGVAPSYESRITSKAKFTVKALS